MPIFKEMDPEIARKAIEGQEDVLTAEGEALQALYKRFNCPRCKCALQKELDFRTMYSDGNVMNARAMLRCPNCRYLIDPHANLVVEYGDPSKTPLETIPTIGSR